MKIGFDAKRLFFNRSGLGNYGRSAIDALCHHFPDNEYLLYTPKGGNVGYRPVDSAHVIYPNSFAGNLSQRWWRLAGLSSQIRHDGLDAYHGFNNELPLGISNSGCKKVITVHDLILKRFPHYFKPVDRFIYEKKGRWATDVADLVIAISEQTKRDLMEFYGVDQEKIRVVYQGCDESFRKPVYSEVSASVKKKYSLPSEYVLSVGTIEPRKNQKLIIDGIASTDLDIPIVLIGKRTSYCDEIIRHAETLGIGNRLQLIHDADFADLPAIYSEASAFVYPSRFEGFGIPILEALCVGIPVIAATGSCLEETGGADSLYVNPDDAEAMGNALKNILSDSELRAKMISAGSLHAGNFTEEKVATGLMNVYRELYKTGKE